MLSNLDGAGKEVDAIKPSTRMWGAFLALVGHPQKEELMSKNTKLNKYAQAVVDYDVKAGGSAQAATARLEGFPNISTFGPDDETEIKGLIDGGAVA